MSQMLLILAATARGRGPLARAPRRLGRRASPRRRFRDALLLAALSASGALLPLAALRAEPVAVRFAEGVVHGYLTLRTLDGKRLADGELSQVARGDRVTSRLVFHFRDGSIQDETVVYSQRGSFRLLSDRLVQRGPTFPLPLAVVIDGRSGMVTVRYTEDGKEKLASERLDLPPDVANGLILTLLKNVPRKTQQLTVSMVAATPKPRLVKLAIAPAGEESFSIGASTRQATRYVLKVEIGGVAGVVAPLVGKQPPDIHVWIQGGTAPSFVKMQGPLYSGGPIWVIQLASPVWPRVPAAAEKR
jgi:hypothetical protein